MRKHMRIRFRLRQLVGALPLFAAVLTLSSRWWGATGFVGALLVLATVSALVVAFRHGRWLPLGFAWYFAALFHLKAWAHGWYDSSLWHVVSVIALGWVLGCVAGWAISAWLENWLKKMEKRMRWRSVERGEWSESETHPFWNRCRCY